jgi:hypothetical protein
LADAEPSIAAMIDLDRYPVHDLGSARTQVLIADVWAQLAASGSCVLDGFLTAQAVAAAAAEARILVPLAHRTAAPPPIWRRPTRASRRVTRSGGCSARRLAPWRMICSRPTR